MVSSAARFKPPNSVHTGFWFGSSQTMERLVNQIKNNISKVVGEVDVAKINEELREMSDSELKKWESETLKIGVIGASGTGNQECFELENREIIVHQCHQRTP